MNVLDLFSGIGGFSLGLERAGMRTVAFCEIDPYCRKVLAKHWPDIPVYGDIRELTAARLMADADRKRELQPEGSKQDQRGRVGHRRIDVICGGFPCQDISVAGKGAGLAGTRSGLWSEYARIIGELRPRFVIVENVAALLGRGLGTVLGDLAALGYDAEWHCIPASAVGAPHRRDRVWIIADTECREQPLGRAAGRVRWLDKSISGNGDWPITSEPVLGRGTDGIPGRMDRLRGLGNAVVPQIPEIIGRAIMRGEL